MFKVMLLSAVLLGGAMTAGCAAVVGGAAVGSAYEYENKKTLKDLERDYRNGRISREEYLRRRDELSDRSVVY